MTLTTSMPREPEKARYDDVGDAVGVEVAGSGGVEARLVLLIDARDAKATAGEGVQIDGRRVALAEQHVADADVEPVPSVREMRADREIAPPIAVDIADRLDRLAEKVAVLGAVGARARGLAGDDIAVRTQMLEVDDARRPTPPNDVRQALGENRRRQARAA
ncbi:MAG TPA: hypothetical protein VFY45_23090, partial [Baekduia sp.]|nr:hypothetical protein [Baekduia sp.]